MKKLLAYILVFTLVLGMGAFAFAVEYPDWEKIQVEKEINLTNDGTVHPEETFNFTVGVGEVFKAAEGVTAPEFNPATFSIEISEDGLSGTEEINLPTFEHVGEYTYPITEVEGNTAGFDYNLTPKYLRITVINDGEGGFIRVVTLIDESEKKLDAFENEFSAGSLLITKEITGNYAVFTDEFEVTVTLSHLDDLNIKEGPIEIEGAVGDEGSVVKNSDGTVTVTFKVTHESEVEIKNIPYGVSYEVTEDSGDYDETITDESGIITEPSQTVEIVNKLDTEINTGINLDNLPYILILVGAAAGLVAFTLKRRVSDEK